MNASHTKRVPDRHFTRSLMANSFRANTMAACLVLLAMITGLSWTQNVNAQAFPADGPGSWGLFVLSDFPEMSNVVVGDVINSLNVISREVLFESETIFGENTYSLWQVEPADAARLITPTPVYPGEAFVEIEFLRATTVTVRARAYYDGAESPFSTPQGANELEFTFNVQPSADGFEEAQTETVDPDAASPLSINQQQTQTAITALCDATQAGIAQPGGEQVQRLATCNSIALLDDPAPALDRISAEELFAIGDALTMTADNQISNIQTRINRLRARNTERLDLDALNITLWNQSVPGSVVNLVNLVNLVGLVGLAGLAGLVARYQGLQVSPTKCPEVVALLKTASVTAL